VEILVDFAIVAIVSTAVLSAYSVSFKVISLAQAKIAAVALANEKMEIIRNMPYDDLATQHGPIYPPGNLLDTESITRNGINFTVNTVISYVDDPYDGNAEGTIPNQPKDLYPYDYKKVEITVLKTGRSGHLAKISSNVAAKAAETPSNSGIIKVCLIDSLSQSVPDATITITNPEADPPVNMVVQSDINGCIMIPNLPPDQHNQYHVTVSKDGYSTDSTEPRTAQNPNALKPDIDILIQEVTNVTLQIDRVSTMVIDVKDTNGTPIGNAQLHLQGKKEIYFNPSTPKYSHDFVTDANGHLQVDSLEFDDYTITLPNWNIASTSPYQPISLKANTTLPVIVTATLSATYPTVESAEPISGQVGETVSLSVIGSNFGSDPLIKMVSASGSEIVGQNVSVSRHSGKEIIDADFDLSGAATGQWSIIISTGGQIVTQTDGFEVTP